MEIVLCDVLCLGGGGAGIVAALTAAKFGARVCLVSKEPLGYGDTRASMGMISCPGLLPGDDEEAFYCDIINGGEHLGNPRLARIMAGRARQACAMLEHLGLLFQRDEYGRFGKKVVYETGGHSFPRTIGCPPGGGIAMGNVLRSAVAKYRVKIFEEMAACSLLHEDKRVGGAICYDLLTGQVVIFRARAVIMATGGGGWLYYPQTDCTLGTTGDGFALAYEAGAQLIDMEQVQFIPFGLTHPPPLCGVFVGEPNIAAPAGILCNRKGEVILEGLSRMTRAGVTRAMAEELSRGGATKHGGLILDLRPNLLTAEGRCMWEVRRKKGQLNVVKFAYGEDAYRWKEPWDVAPTAHYFMGGIKIDSSGRSTVEGLLAAGQVAGGVHGGNRLGSVSLAELIVFGAAAGKAAVEVAKTKHLQTGGATHQEEISAAEILRIRGLKGSFSPLELQRRLQKVMWQKAGVFRQERTLREGLNEVQKVEKDQEKIVVSAHKTYNLEILRALELRHMITVARLILQAALCREESRGAHFRLDFPKKNDEKWKRNIIQLKLDKEMKTCTGEVGS